VSPEVAISIGRDPGRDGWGRASGRASCSAERTDRSTSAGDPPVAPGSRL